jgi:hypothetical protein
MEGGLSAFAGSRRLQAQNMEEKMKNKACTNDLFVKGIMFDSAV